MKYKRYTLEFKEKAVKEYLAGKGMMAVCRENEINKAQLRHWANQWKEFGTFPYGRGKAQLGRPKSVDTSKMSKDEYIKYLEMENDILKSLRSLNNKKQ